MENNFVIDLNVSMNINDNDSTKVLVDRPDYKWPSGTIQGASITSAALLAARNMPGGPLHKGFAAIGVGAFMTGLVGYSMQ